MKDRMANAVVIGASAGAVDALSSILPMLPKNFPVPILIVVHLPPEQDSLLPQLMQARCALNVKEAEDKEPIQPGAVYFAPPNYHLLVEADRTIAFSNDEPVLFCRPSVDVLFEAAADVYGAGLVGIVMTGANYDGTDVLRAIRKAGGTAIVQNPQGAFASTMPQSALKACPDALVLDVKEIGEYLQHIKLIEPAHDAA